MESKNLKIFTNISFYIAMVKIIVIPISLYTSDKSMDSMLGMLALLVFLTSLFAIPLCLISMFSKENLAKRTFALLVNLLPIILIVYALVTELIDEFLRTAP